MVPYSILARRVNYFICSPAENRTQFPRLKAECIANNASKDYSITLVLRSIEGLRFLYLYVLYCFHNSYFFLLVRHTGIEPAQLTHQFYRLAQLSYVGGTPIMPLSASVTPHLYSVNLLKSFVTFILRTRIQPL
jgi:hypothetical protein